MEVSCRDLGHDAEFPEMSKAFREIAAKIPNRVPLFAKFRDSVQVVSKLSGATLSQFGLEADFAS